MRENETVFCLFFAIFLKRGKNKHISNFLVYRFHAYMLSKFSHLNSGHPVYF